MKKIVITPGWERTGEYFIVDESNEIVQQFIHPLSSRGTEAGYARIDAELEQSILGEFEAVFEKAQPFMYDATKYLYEHPAGDDWYLKKVRLRDTDPAKPEK